jgi:hypothetical protein
MVPRRSTRNCQPRLDSRREKRMLTPGSPVARNGAVIRREGSENDRSARHEADRGPPRRRRRGGIGRRLTRDGRDNSARPAGRVPDRHAPR